MTEPKAGATSVEVTVHLMGGMSCRAQLASDSELLQDLFRALAGGTRGVPPEPPRLIQLPTDGGEKAYSFSSTNLVAVETRPPVLIEETLRTARVPRQPQPAKPAAPRESRPKADPAARKRRGAPIVRDTQARTLPAAEPLPFVQVTDFLTPDEQNQLFASVLREESNFVCTNAETRELLSVPDPAFSERIGTRLRLLLPHVLPGFDPLRAVEPISIQLFAQQDGYVRHPKDIQAVDTDLAEITCMYFFQKESKLPSGGEFRLRKGESTHLIEPRNNAVMVFPTSALVEVLPLHCPSNAFEDSRFAVAARVV